MHSGILHWLRNCRKTVDISDNTTKKLNEIAKEWKKNKKARARAKHVKDGHSREKDRHITVILNPMILQTDNRSALQTLKPVDVCTNNIAFLFVRQKENMLLSFLEKTLYRLCGHSRVWKFSIEQLLNSLLFGGKINWSISSKHLFHSQKLFSMNKVLVVTMQQISHILLKFCWKIPEISITWKFDCSCW